MATQLSTSTIIATLVSLAALGSFWISYTNSLRAEAIADSKEADARQECKLETLRAEMRCKDTCAAERATIFEGMLLPKKAKKP